LLPRCCAKPVMQLKRPGLRQLPPRLHRRAQIADQSGHGFGAERVRAFRVSNAVRMTSPHCLASSQVTARSQKNRDGRFRNRDLRDMRQCAVGWIGENADCGERTLCLEKTAAALRVMNSMSTANRSGGVAKRGVGCGIRISI